MDMKHSPERVPLSTQSAGLSQTEVIQKIRSLLDKHSQFQGHQESIQIDYQDGNLVLTGYLHSYYLKQLLQASLRDVQGIERIVNRVRVVPVAISSSENHPWRKRNDPHTR